MHRWLLLGAGVAALGCMGPGSPASDRPPHERPRAGKPGSARHEHFERVDLGADSKGEKRTAFVHLPKGHDPKRDRAPVLHVFHGGRQNNATEVMPYFKKYLDQGYILSFPNGQMKDPEHGGFHVREGNDLQHVEVIERLVARLGAEYGADPARHYALGFSSGGQMTLQLACHRPELFAGFAPMHRGLTVSLRDACAPSVVRPMVFMAGTHDASAPWDGKNAPDGRPHELGAEESVDFWLRRAGCAAEPTRVVTLPDRGDAVTVEKRIYDKCTGASAMAFYVIKGGAHVWPGADGQGKGSCRDIEAADEIVSFFRSECSL